MGEVPSTSIFEIYKKIFRKPYMLVVLVIYMLLIFIYIFYPKIKKGFTSEVEVLKLRLRDTQVELEKNKQLIYELSDKERKFGFLRKIEIRNEKITDLEKIEVSRLIDYAEFAIEKEDFKYAKQFYNEANNSIETAIGHYYLGRLFYIQGITQKAEFEWKKAIKIDKNFNYPEFRFFLSILLFELDKDKESKESLKSYLKE